MGARNDTSHTHCSMHSKQRQLLVKSSTELLNVTPLQTSIANHCKLLKPHGCKFLTLPMLSIFMIFLLCEFWLLWVLFYLFEFCLHKSLSNLNRGRRLSASSSIDKVPLGYQWNLLNRKEWAQSWRYQVWALYILFMFFHDNWFLILYLMSRYSQNTGQTYSYLTTYMYMHIHVRI